MKTLHTVIVNGHIAFGAIALVLFWVPALAKKGSPLHVRAGRAYVIVMYVVAITAFCASVIVLSDPLGTRRPGLSPDGAEAADLAGRFRMFSLFLLMLSVLVFASLRHGIAALRARTAPGALSNPAHRVLLAALLALAIVVGIIGVTNRQLLLVVFAAIGLAGGAGMMRDTRMINPGRRQLVVAHLNGLIGSGIGAYTAFFAFGGSRLLADLLTGQWMVVPWVLPAVIGSFAINRLKRPFQRRDAQQAG